MTKDEAKFAVRDAVNKLNMRPEVPRTEYVTLILRFLRNYNFLVYCPITGLPLRDVRMGKDGILNYIV